MEKVGETVPAFYTGNGRQDSKMVVLICALYTF
jgi:hypothetical protein